MRGGWKIDAKGNRIQMEKEWRKGKNQQKNWEKKESAKMWQNEVELHIMGVKYGKIWVKNVGRIGRNLIKQNGANWWK